MSVFRFLLANWTTAAKKLPRQFPCRWGWSVQNQLRLNCKPGRCQTTSGDLHGSVVTSIVFSREDVGYQLQHVVTVGYVLSGENCVVFSVCFFFFLILSAGRKLQSLDLSAFHRNSHVQLSRELWKKLEFGQGPGHGTISKLLTLRSSQNLGDGNQNKQFCLEIDPVAVFAKDNWPATPAGLSRIRNLMTFVTTWIIAKNILTERFEDGYPQKSQKEHPTM